MTVAALERVTLCRDGRAVLSDASVRIAPGDRIALIGPNGAGKSTLLRVLLGLEPPTSGAVTACVAGCGYVPQAYSESLFPWFSVLRNAAMPRLVSRRRDAYAVAGALCERLLPGVDPQRPAGRLSGGEKQALALGRALGTPGDVLLADEPFSALSSSARARARQVLSEQLGARAFVLVTHSEDDIAGLCDRVLRMDAGRPVEVHATKGRG